MKLRLGEMTNQEIAEWAGLSPTYFAKHRKQWCEKQLTHYATFILNRGSITITHIFDPFYATPARKLVAQNFESCWGYEGNKIDTCRLACEKLYHKLKPTALKDTIYNYTCAEKRKRFGVPKRYEGSLGYSEFTLCKIVDGELLDFTDQENDIRGTLMAEYLQTREDQVLTARAAKQAFASGELSAEDYQAILDQIIDNDVGWETFITKFEEAIGYPVTFATRLIEDAIKYLQKGEPLCSEKIL